MYLLDDRYINNKANDPMESSQVSQDRTKRGPPTNKNISVRNIKAQIANMSSNESAGFKSEYQVRFSIVILFHFDEFYEILHASYNMTYKKVGCCKMYH